MPSSPCTWSEAQVCSVWLGTMQALPSMHLSAQILVALRATALGAGVCQHGEACVVNISGPLTSSMGLLQAKRGRGWCSPS